ncbi:hypothetical protein KCP69_11760 [Salmonella enterica subsp. enterica]|nr:hypothetical protein KCP69_11760 [Salmonella enterica subsp. enterica]
MSAGYGPGAADGAGGLLCPRGLRATAAVNHCRRPMETQRTVITAVDFSADYRAGAQRAGDDPDESR